MTLTTKFKQGLKGQAHKLKPVVMVGNHGVTPAVIKEVDRALNDHTLIKIRISVADREEKRAAFAEICDACEAEAVQLIGNIGVIYRKPTEE